MKILGISAFYHDSAAALLDDGAIIAAAQEERFTRSKHDARFPSNAVAYCLSEAGCALDDIDYVAFYDSPSLKFQRILATSFAVAPAGRESFTRAMHSWVFGGKLFQKRQVAAALRKVAGSGVTIPPIRCREHHESHAASAFFPSPFESAAILTLDGVGEWATTSLGFGSGTQLTMAKEIRFPHSLGLLYSAFTQYLGFKVNSGEYKVMGLAPYGDPIYRDRIFDHLIDIKPDGTFRLAMDYFAYCTAQRMIAPVFEELFGGPARQPEAPLEQRHMDIAASIQVVIEEIVLRLARNCRQETGASNLCLAGGVALNCVANGRLLREAGFERIWVQPAAGDAGGALGAAYALHYDLAKDPTRIPADADAMQGSYLGPSFEQEDIEKRLTALGAKFETYEPEALIGQAAAAILRGDVVGWFQGRMEFGPRALGARSILGDPRSPTMQKTLNLRIKFRESFRPFAPSVLYEEASDWFDLDVASPYMLLVTKVAQQRRRSIDTADDHRSGLARLDAVRSEIPAVTHVDDTARVQTVHRETNPLYHRLIERFAEASGCPVLVNTSFNVRGEPIVCSPEDAYRCFMATDMEALAIGRCWLVKRSQPDPGDRFVRRFAAD